MAPAADYTVGGAGWRPSAQAASLESAVGDADRWRGCRGYGDIVEQGVRRIGTVVVVMAREGKCVAVPRGQRSGSIRPGIAGARFGQQCGGRVGGVVLQSDGCPIVGHRVRTRHLVPETDPRSSRRCRESLGDVAIAVGGTCAAQSCSIGAGMSSGHDRS